jgi:hypothetical protein
VPQIGRFLQTDPVSGGSANAYAYGFGDPVDETDLSGEYTPHAPPWLAEYEESPPGLPPPPPPPVIEAEFEAYEVDPTDRGKFGRLHVSIEVEGCDEMGCQANFHFRGDIVGAGGRSSALHLWVSVYNPDWPHSEPVEDYGVINGTRTGSYTLSLFIPYGTWYAFRLFVRVGNHTETLGLAFSAEKHEIVW